MNYERFIAKRISGAAKKNFSALIFRIAIVAVALSITVMIITTSVITGFKNGISNKVFNFWGHIHVTDGKVGNSFELIPINKDYDLIKEIESIGAITYQRPPSVVEPDFIPAKETSIGGISRVESYTIVPGIISSKQSFEGVLLKGFESSHDLANIEPFMVSGAFIDFSNGQASRDIVISQQMARRLEFDIGDALVMNFILEGDQYKRRFTISGIYKTGLEEYDRRFALVDTRILQDVLGWNANQVSGLEIYVDDLDDLRLLNEYIYFEKLPRNLYSESIRSKFYQIFEWLELQNINEDVLLALMMIVAIINMITAILIFVLENTGTIGLLKSIGATDWSIRKIFLYNASDILIKGIVLGNLLAFALCLIQLQTGVMKLSEKEYYLSTVPIEFNWAMISFINIGTIAITLLFLIVPTLIVTKIQPVKALKFD